MTPITEFRTLSVFGPEPGDRTTQGTVIGNGNALDLGTVDTTDEARDIPVRVVWWRVRDLNGATEIRNIRLWLEGSDIGGSAVWLLDITDVWTPGKAPVQVETGTPGTAPIAEGAPNLLRMGGGIITGITNDQTSQYIYLSGRAGVNVPTGAHPGIKLVVKYDWR